MLREESACYRAVHGRAMVTDSTGMAVPKQIEHDREAPIRGSKTSRPVFRVAEARYRYTPSTNGHVGNEIYIRPAVLPVETV